MHYDDQLRRSNVLTGFACGALLGLGVGLLLPRRPRPGPLRSAAADLPRALRKAGRFGR